MCTGTAQYYEWERDAYKGTNDLIIRHAPPQSSLGADAPEQAQQAPPQVELQGAAALGVAEDGQGRLRRVMCRSLVCISACAFLCKHIVV